MRLLVLLLSLCVYTSDAASCVSVNTLTSSCENLCFTGRPCVALTSGTSCPSSPFNTCVKSTSTGCTFSCLKYGIDDFIANNIIEYSKFIFLIPYAGFISQWESKWDNDDKTAAASTQSLSNDTNLYPSVNDTILDAIAPLQFRHSMKTLIIAGGSSVVGGVRGRVVDVKMAPSVLVDQTNLLSVTLSNIQLEQIPLNSFPSQLLNLTICNGVLTQVPNDIEKLGQLNQLDLSKNYLKTYPAKFSGLNQLQVLNLSQNSLENFESNNGFQALISLDLSDNLLSTIPPSIFTLSTLRSLDLRKNSFSNLQFTREQVQFLNQIPSFHIDAVGLSTSCNEKTTLGSIQVCLASSNGNGSNSSTAMAAWVGGSIGTVVLILLLLFLYRRHRRPASFHTKSKYKSQTGSDLGDFSSANGIGSLWNDQELLSLQVNADDIQDIRKLGAGAFCIVYLAKYRNTRYVASKRLKRDELNQKNIKLFIQEIKLVSTLDHPRIVALIGVAWTIEADLQALFEYMENGDVRRYLENPSTSRYWSNEKLQIVIDAIEGLVYVHSFTLPIIHRDLKTRNILLDGQYRAKLCDFGVARYRSDGNQTMTTGVGTGRWLAPEVISGSSDYDQACDIFSFGVVLSEMDTHTLPYEDVRGPNGNQIADVALLQMVASGTILPSFTRQCPPDLYQLALRCLSLDPKDRPSGI